VCGHRVAEAVNALSLNCHRIKPVTAGRGHSIYFGPLRSANPFFLQQSSIVFASSLWIVFASSLAVVHCREISSLQWSVCIAVLFVVIYLISAMTVRSFVSDMSDMTMLAQRGQNYEHVHIISITHISFSYVQISVSIQIRVHIRRSRGEIRWSGSWNSSKWKLKFVVEVYGRSRQTNRRIRMLKHFFVQYDNFFIIYTEYVIIMQIIMSNRMQPQSKVCNVYD
jgi:hypothetical protein